MTDGYHDKEDDDFSDLDEWLCEYVDGTIDPAARNALEDNMRANPALARHVQHLLQARNLLCRYGCRHQAPHGLQPRLQERLALESCTTPAHGSASLASRLGMLATVSSLIALSIFVGSFDTSQSADQSPLIQATTKPIRPFGHVTRATLFASPDRRALRPAFDFLSTVSTQYPQVPQTLSFETLVPIEALAPPRATASTLSVAP